MSDKEENQPRAKVPSSASRLTRWLVHLVVVLACIIPSVWINVKAQIDLGSGMDMVAAAIGFAVLAPILTLNCYASARDRQYGLAVAWGAIAAVFICLNTVLALGGYSAVRDKVMDVRAAKMRQAQSHSSLLTDARQRIAELTKTAGAASPEMIAASIASMQADRLYIRSLECASVTKGDSENFCKRLMGERQRMAAATEIRRIEGDIERGGWGVSTAEEPSATDPQIENLTALTVAILGVKYESRLMAATLSVFLALMTELLADIGPVAILFAWGRMGRKGRGEIELFSPSLSPSLPLPVIAEKPMPGIASAPPLPLPLPLPVLGAREGQDGPGKGRGKAPPKPGKTPLPKAGEASLGDVAQWAEDCVEKSTGGREQSTALHGLYSAWCEARTKKPVTAYAFALTMKQLGWTKIKTGGKIFYEGMSTKKQTLRVVQ